MAVVIRSNLALENYSFVERMDLPFCVARTGKPWPQYFRDLLPLGTSEGVITKLHDWCKTSDRTRWDIVRGYTKPNVNALEVLSAIRGAGHEQILISVTTPEALDKYIELLGFERFFPDGRCFGICGSGLSKMEVLDDFVGKNRGTGRIIGIGDSYHDLLGDNNFLYAHPDGRAFREVPETFVKPYERVRDLSLVLKSLNG